MLGADKKETTKPITETVGPAAAAAAAPAPAPAPTPAGADAAGLTATARKRAGRPPDKKVATYKDIPDVYGTTSLMWAIRVWGLGEVKALLDAGADANLPDGIGDIPLLAAAQLVVAQKGEVKTVELLLAAGARFDKAVVKKLYENIPKWLEISPSIFLIERNYCTMALLLECKFKYEVGCNSSVKLAELIGRVSGDFYEKDQYKAFLANSLLRSKLPYEEVVEVLMERNSGGPSMYECLDDKTRRKVDEYMVTGIVDNDAPSASAGIGAGGGGAAGAAAAAAAAAAVVASSSEAVTAVSTTAIDAAATDVSRPITRGGAGLDLSASMTASSTYHRR